MNAGKDHPPPGNPLIVTVELDPASQQSFDALRSELFPPGRTVIGAHLSLFHALPAELIGEVCAQLTLSAGRPAFAVEVAEVMALGQGVAYRVISAELSELHRQLQRQWWAELTPQDRQGFRAHITVQNKVTVDVARVTLARLRAAFTPTQIGVLGLQLWSYEQGPWRHLQRFSFGSKI